MWCLSGDNFNLAIAQAPDAEWFSAGPMGVGVFGLRNLLLRLIWCAAFPQRGLAGMPQGWFHGRCPNIVTIPIRECGLSDSERLPELLANLWLGRLEPFESWLQARSSQAEALFEASIRTADLQTLRELLLEQRATFNLQPATNLQLGGTGPKCAAHEA
jgi:hypothetical protein